jgi:hypothetical protein
MSSFFASQRARLFKRAYLAEATKGGYLSASLAHFSTSSGTSERNLQCATS